jgi:hypothetical protein
MYTKDVVTILSLLYRGYPKNKYFENFVYGIAHMAFWSRTQHLNFKDLMKFVRLSMKNTVSNNENIECEWRTCP